MVGLVHKTRNDFEVLINCFDHFSSRVVIFFAQMKVTNAKQLP